MRCLFAVGGVLMLMLLSGCATRLLNTLHPSYGQADLNRDTYECERENTYPKAAVAGSQGSAGMEVNYSLVISCLKARGWQRVKE